MHTSLKRKFVEFVYKYKNLSLLTKNAISIKDVMEIAITRVFLKLPNYASLF